MIIIMTILNNFWSNNSTYPSRDEVKAKNTSPSDEAADKNTQGQESMC